MSTWKKVALIEDIATFAGGSDTTQLGGANGDVIIGDGSGDFGTPITLSDGHLLVGQGSGNVPVSRGIDASSDISMSDSASGIDLQIKANVVTNNEIASNTIQLGNIDNGGFATGDISGNLLYWDSSQNAAMLAPGSENDILKVNASGVPEWGTLSAAGTVTINNGSAGTSAYGIMFGTTTASDGGLDNNKIYIDVTDGSTNVFTYEPDAAFSHADASNTAAVVSTGGFKGDLAGTATNAVHATTTTMVNGTTYYVTSSDSATGAAGKDMFTGGTISMTPNATPADSATTVTGDLTITGDLIVSGDTVTVNTKTVEIEDCRIRLAHTDTAATNSNDIQALSQSLGVGIIVDNGNKVSETDTITSSDKLARFTYNGHKTSSYYDASNSVMGWVMSQEVEDGAISVAPTVGVGAMHVLDAGTGGAAQTLAQVQALDFGVGCFAYVGAGAGAGLWIQTASDLD